MMAGLSWRRSMARLLRRYRCLLLRRGAMTHSHLTPRPWPRMLLPSPRHLRRNTHEGRLKTGGSGKMIFAARRDFPARDEPGFARLIELATSRRKKRRAAEAATPR